MAQSNIQVLFARISSADIREYLVAHGWTEDIPLEAGTHRFTAPGRESNEEAEIWFWGEDGDSRFRRRVPDILFTLCLHEDRPALDIANEMFGLGQKALARARAAQQALGGGVTTTSQSAPPAIAQAVRWSFAHRGSDSLLVQIRPHGGMHTIEPGDRLLLVAPPETPVRDTGALFDVEWSDSVVRVDCPDAVPGPRLFLGLADRVRASELEARIQRELRELPAERGDASPDEVFEQVTPVLRRVVFELDQDGATDETMRGTALRQAAVLAVALVRHLPATSLARRALWRTLLVVFATARIALELDANLLEELSITALNDAVNSPVQTLALLKRVTD